VIGILPKRNLNNGQPSLHAARTTIGCGAGSPPRGARIDATTPIGCSEMALIFTAEHVVRSIAAERPCATSRRGRPPAGAGGGDPAAIRRASPPGAAARADAAVAEGAGGGVSGVEFFRKRRRLAAGGSFGMCQEQLTVALVGRTAQIDPNPTFTSWSPSAAGLIGALGTFLEQAIAA
jgi:hypothetical protein